jgi:hypothetical protein
VPVRDTYNKRLSALKSERSSFISHWKDLSDYTAPRRGRFVTTDRNKGGKRHSNIINARAMMALRTLSSGMMAGITSPARPWFRLQTPDPDMMEFTPVKLWLADVEHIMREIFNQSNLYNVLPAVYREMGTFATGCMSVVDDFDNVSRFYTHTVGAYMLAQNQKYQVDTMYREFEMTVGQIVGEFGTENASQFVRDHYDKGQYDSWVPIVHAIEPNVGRDARKVDAKNKPFRSVWYEAGAGTQDDKLLRESGFDEFPVMAPRWDVTGEDIYGTDCPGMTALGDIKQLQLYEKRKAQIVEKIGNPPLHGPGALTNVPIINLPGGATIYDGTPGGNKLEPIHEIHPSAITAMSQDIALLENRIDTIFYADLFMLLDRLEGVQPRNVMELAERKEEKLLMLGPVLERLHGELLNPMIDRVFAQMVRADILPPPPDELQGQPLKVEYISMLAQAQRAVSTASIDRLAAFIGGLASAQAAVGMAPDVWDKFDADQSIDEYAEAIGTAPALVRSDDDVAERRAAKAQQQQLTQAAQMAKPMADAAQAAETVSKIGREDGSGAL